MRVIIFFIFIFGIHTGFAQSNKTDRIYQYHNDFKEVEDSIANRINLQNTIIYKTCEGYRSFYLIQENLHWTGYFIKNLGVDELNLPVILDTLENGDFVEFKPYKTELLIFNADSIVKMLLQDHINNIHQISEEAIQAKITRKGKEKGERIVLSLPYSSHDCNGTIVIYGQRKISATYRGVLIEAENVHIIPTLRIFYETKQILINSIKNYYQ